jgi:penicillin amidase/acyl-homoserine-lactone acylase
LAVIALSMATAALAWRALTPGPAPATEAMKARAANVEILRDRFGVPHVFGKTDADAAFGFAYASAEDHWETTQTILIAGRGEASRIKLSKKALQSDFFVQFAGIGDIVEAEYDSLRPDVRKVLEAYAEGLNYYAAKHPGEADARFLPWTGKDIARQFVFKVTLFMGLTKAIKKVRAGDLAGGTGVPSERNGSNAHAVAPWRSADGIARLNVNSHLDWEGFRAWQEAHVVSEEGWNFSGGYLAASPFLIIGHNDDLGWTFTVNRPDLVDVYEIERHPDDPLRYRLDGEWKTMEERVARLPLEFGPFSWTLKKKFYRTVHGPALEANGKLYAFRTAGVERAMDANEQLFDMNKARDFAGFKRAFSKHALPMFNLVYADAGNIYYHYNALIPERAEGYPWRGVVPGNTSKTLWRDYIPLASLPSVENPASGWVQNCNATPFETTSAGENPPRDSVPLAAGIETYTNNRTLRSHETFGADASITREEFLRYKWDRRYSKRAPLYAKAIAPLLSSFEPETDHEREALELLRGFDGRMELDSRAAALVIKTYNPIYNKQYEPENAPSPEQTFREAVAWLVEHHGRVDPPLRDVQFIARGGKEIPVAGGPSVLHVVDRHRVGRGKLFGTHGDGFMQIVEFPKGAPARSVAVHQFGSSSRSGSKHYDDQMELFAKRGLRPTWRTREEILANLDRRYRP